MTASFTNATTRTNAAELTVTEVLAAGVIEAAYSTTVCRPLVRNESLAGKPTNKMDFPAWPALTAASVAETADLTNTAINTTEVSATVGEVGIMIALTDALTEDDILAGLDQYARQGGRALADKEDADIAALFASFSNTSGTTGTNLTQSTFLAAIRALDARDAPKPFCSVLHPEQAHDLGEDIVTNGGNIWASGSAPADSRFGSQPREMYGTLYNVPIYTSTNVTDDATDNSGAIMSTGEALAFVAKREARVEFERDASARLTEIVITSRYATVELVDNYGQEILSTAS